MSKASSMRLTSSKFPFQRCPVVLSLRQDHRGIVMLIRGRPECKFGARWCRRDRLQCNTSLAFRSCDGVTAGRFFYTVRPSVTKPPIVSSIFSNHYAPRMRNLPGLYTYQLVPEWTRHRSHSIRSDR